MNYRTRLSAGGSGQGRGFATRSRNTPSVLAGRTSVLQSAYLSACRANTIFLNLMTSLRLDPGRPALSAIIFLARPTRYGGLLGGPHRLVSRFGQTNT